MLTQRNCNRVFMLLMVGLLAACGRGEATEPTVEPSPPPAVAPTFTPTVQPAALPAALPAANSPLATPDVITETDSIAAADSVTAADNVTASGEISGGEEATPSDSVTEDVTEGVTNTSQASAPTCAIQPALDLAGYPNLVETLGCPQSEGSFEPVALNEFSGPADDADGAALNPYMLWFGAEERIYALLPSGQYELFDDTWDEATEEEYLCNPLGDEVDSPPLPRRGFGKIWCSSEQLQQTLGQVEREERLCQHAVTQEFQAGRLVACFEDATVYYFQLTEGGQWSLQVQ